MAAKGVKKQKHLRDMTEGNPWNVITAFAIPLMAASVIQQLFSLTDAMILGIFGGDVGLAVLGTTSWPVWFSVSILTAFCQAACLLAAVRFGAKDDTAFRQAVGTVYLITAMIGIGLTLVLQALVLPLLKLQETPSAVLRDAAAYLRILYGGIPFLLIYNMLASLLRAAGDSRTSFAAITVSALLNIILDVWMVAGLGLGAAGAAAATVTAQSAAAVICIREIRKYQEFKITRKELRFYKHIVKEYVGLCIPMIAQSFVIALGGVFVQFKINQYGTVFAAGVSAAEKIFSVVETAAVALSQACASFVSQNVGAGKFDNIKTVVRRICCVSEVIAGGIAVVLLLGGERILALFVTENAMEYAMADLVVISVGLLIMYPMYSLRQTIQALGNLWIPLLAGVLQLVVRILTAQYLPLIMGHTGLFLPNIAAWLVSLLLIGAVYPGQLRKCER